MASIKKNFIYSSLLTCSSYIFSFLTFPYVTRVLGVNNIGICNFVDSIIQYFIIFSMMGVTTIGIREVAKSKGYKKELSKVFSSFVTINLAFTFLSIIILIICCLCIPKLQSYSQLIYIGIAKIIANSLLIEWLYNGLENFKYITVRSLIIRSLYVVSVFLLIRDETDYIQYFSLNVLTFVVNSALNLAYSQNFVSFSFKYIEIRKYLTSYIILGIYMILTNLYSTFNIIYLGFVSNDTEVGYYTTATKLYTIIMSIFTAFTGVMMPRMSSLVANNQMEDFRKLTSKSINALFAFSVPLIIISELCAPQIISILAGGGYESAILPMRIIMPLILIIGYEQIIILQILAPLKKDSAILTNSAIGASVGLLLNFMLVSSFASIGSSIVLMASELSVLLSAQYFVSKYIDYKMPIKALLKRLVLCLPIVLLCYFLNNDSEQVYFSLILISAIVLLYWILIEMLVMHNIVVSDLFRKLLNFRLLKD